MGVLEIDDFSYEVGLVMKCRCKHGCIFELQYCVDRFDVGDFHRHGLHGDSTTTCVMSEIRNLSDWMDRDHEYAGIARPRSNIDLV